MATVTPTLRVIDADGQPVTGDAPNLTLSVIADGVATAYSGDITEVDDGEYSVVVTQAGTLQSVSGASSTSGAIVIPARWQNSPAVGSNVVTITVEDGDGDPVGSCPVRVANAGGQLLGYGLTNSATGVVVFNLDSGAYAVTLGPLSDYSPANPYSITVAGATTETLTVTAISIPTPADPSLCVVYADMRNAVGGQLLGAGEGWLNVVSVNARPAGSTEVLADDADNDAPALTDGSGRAALSIIQGAVVRIRATWPDGHTKTVQLTVPDQDAYDVGADL
jgi:hypothetical protein